MLGPVRFTAAAFGHLLLELLFGLQQSRVFGVFGDRIILLSPPIDFDVIFVGQRKDVTAIIELRSPRTSENLLCRSGLINMNPLIGYSIDGFPIRRIDRITDGLGQLIVAVRKGLAGAVMRFWGGGH